MKLQYFPCSSDGKEPAYNAGNPGLIPGSGRSPGEGNVNPLQYSSLENYMDRGVWWATVYRAAKSQTWLNKWHVHSHMNRETMYEYLNGETISKYVNHINEGK